MRMRSLRLLIAVFGLAIAPAAAGADDKPSILCLTGPSMKTSIEELARVYEERTGVHVVVEMNDPRSLIERIKVVEHADLFISHDPFLAMLDRDGIKVRRAWNPASLTPVIAVARGNPKGIKGLKDLARPGVRMGVTNPGTAISGNILALMLRKAGVEREVEANVVKRAAAGRQLAAALVADELDAAFVWNAVVYANREKIEAVDVPAEQRPQEGPESVMAHPSLGRIELDHVRVTIALLDSTAHEESARSFAELVASPEGAAVFLAHGFSPADPRRAPGSAEARSSGR
ncbi:substrate-binding domain-containing protein [Paludisphaera mucosa]|uniref:Substrate-binding domain-containing protein n=1 Tax=Paludisphaera mucosa TaxID=3030827 RepID=A0ABT6FGK0_9BACT|nr:substrate-binding domain-containing protein [Paludisphaera mucosa]MDG3006702.1 substrate-binding domain-containing protein [Paludisphaera mucosa]